MLHQLAREAAHVLARRVEALHGAEDGGGVAREDGAGEVFQ